TRPERRGAVRLHRVLFIEVQGDYGSFKAKAINVSQTGVLLSIDDPGFAPPAAPDQLVLFTKRLGFQFRNGMLIRFLETDLSLQADVVRVNEEETSGESSIVIGCKFRRPLTKEECAVLEVPVANEEEGTIPAPPPLARSVPSAFEGRTRIRQLMAQAREVGATDLHVKVGSPPRFRIAGSLLNVGKEIFTQGETHAMALDLMSPGQAQVFEAEGDAELAITLEKIGRFRVNILRQRGYSGLTIRCIPEDVPTLDALGLSPLAKTLAERPRGIVLVTGPTGSGKSTTLAAMVDHINTTRSCHILTMEDPIEYLHKDKEAHITQREVGRDASNFASALKRALRQDPDVIMVGEMRDLETIALAITAAETGHLVFATLHTTSAVLSPDRVVDVFPPEQQSQIRLQVADSLQGIVSQLLIPAIGGGMALAQEILIATEGVRALIRERKTPQIQNLMQTGAKEGMITLETSLNDLVQRGVVTYENAVAKANFPKQIRRRGQ
ncbi:MAG: PilT/PilU family type 4a pilus ATPase, partial [Planctomycetes bacterium]|nr:PilT/PilU family type 4a pilus ATPase [Planctomycetota bacterium]